MKLQSQQTMRFEASALRALAERTHPLYEKRMRWRQRLRTTAWSVAGFLFGLALVLLTRTL